MSSRKVPRLAAPPTTPQALAGVYQDDKPSEHRIARTVGDKLFGGAMSNTKVLHRAPPPPTPYAQVAVYQDVEPLKHRAEGAPAAPTNGSLVLKTHCEFPTLRRGASRDKFTVLVHARAPADVPHAPLDLVTVLDVSGIMEGQKLALLKQAMGFVIDQLGPDDRLSMVSFFGEATRLIPLTRMTVVGKGSAKLAVEGIVVRWTGTNLDEGLRMGAQVLAGCRHKTSPNGGAKDYMTLVSPLFMHVGTRPGPIHTFGLGTYIDAVVMHSIAKATGGTFSFIENQAGIKESFAQCIGGLLSVAVQEARISVTCLHRGVRVLELKSGSYINHMGTDGRAASIDVGELYGGEDRRFLVLMHVPRVRPTESVTRLVKVSCTYKDAATAQVAHVAAPAAVIKRLLELELAEIPAPSIEVERECVRLAATQDMAAAQVAAEGAETPALFGSGGGGCVVCIFAVSENLCSAPDVRGAEGGAA
uniref:Uncharacterized protein n=1 Tax=Aegilops tauschii TaxID=37682 RepID=M8C7H5_AEGTA